MGTRHLIAVQLDGDYKIAQYGQWDGYPDGQGLTVLNFLKTANLEAFRDKLRKTRFATEDEINQFWVNAGANPDSDFVSMDVANKVKQTHPEVSRDTGARILEVVLSTPFSEQLLLSDHREFAQDGLFCEWAYVIDLDAGKLEVYTGFHKEDVTEGRFQGKTNPDMSGYGPIQLQKTYDLDDLPDEETFINDFKNEEE